MTGLRQRFLGLCLPPLVFCVLDFTLTLIGQPAEYWQGDRTSIIEGSPNFHYLLTVHPTDFVVGVLVWIAIFVALLLLLPSWFTYSYGRGRSALERRQVPAVPRPRE